MIYNAFQDLKLSALGFGAMRLPEVDGQVDRDTVAKMVDYAIANGVNYFDTAWPYHAGMSERVMGEVLSRYPRDSYYLADKYPGHQIMKVMDPKTIFEEQLRRCKTEYFDFYLLHNVYEKSIETYMDPDLGVIEYFREQKRLGRIKHLGFSTHAQLDTMERFLDLYGDDMEFCQIQLNYLDWTLQNAKEKYEMLTKRGIPVWVMEPVRGGKLANLPEEDAALLKTRRPDESVAAWGFRFLQDLPNVQMILSGMSNMAQMMDNVQTFREEKPLTGEELALLLEVAEKLKDSVPCTACRYCCDGCPMKLDIPMLLASYNEARVAPQMTIVMRLESLPEEQWPAACIGCGACTESCPQNIDVPSHLQDFAERLNKMPSWQAICREREAAQR